MSPKDFLLYGCVVFAWSTSWLPLHWQVAGQVAPEISILWRFMIAGALCFLVCYLKGLPLRYSVKIHFFLFLMGLFMFSTNFTLFYYAGQHLTSGLLAVVFSTASMVNILLVAGISQTLPNQRQFIAAFIGLSGISLIFWPELNLSDAALPSLLLCVLGTLSFCSGNLVSAALQRRGIAVIAANSWGMFYGCVVLAVFSLFRGHAFIVEPSFHYIGGLLWLAVFSSVIAFASYLTLVGRIGAGRAAYATVLFPVFALLISTFFESYIWTPLALIGIFLVLLGNLVMIAAQ